MLNLAIGSEIDVDGRVCIQTRRGGKGHAVYGPYEQFMPGRYMVMFRLAALDNQAFQRDFVVATLEVTARTGAKRLAMQQVRLSSLQQGPATFTLPFSLAETERLEFRVHVSGLAALVIDDNRRVMRIPDDAADGNALPDDAFFPTPAAAEAPAFFTAHEAGLRRLYESGVGVRILDGNVVLSVDGVSFLARTPDDFNFIGEVFFQNAYNVLSPAETCVIDIGMNIGLVSLLFATKPMVREVHAFEPFRATFDRAMANLAINPALAAKITAHNVALSDRDEDSTLVVADVDASGSMSIVEVADGKPLNVTVRDAGTLLGPVIRNARAAGRHVVIKVDCEGSEFAIFESLDAAGLLGEVSAFMVEWHRMFDRKTQANLIAPLLRENFLVFDQSSPNENGFFYAVRTISAAA